MFDLAVGQSVRYRGDAHFCGLRVLRIMPELDSVIVGSGSGPTFLVMARDVVRSKGPRRCGGPRDLF